MTDILLVIGITSFLIFRFLLLPRLANSVKYPGNRPTSCPSSIPKLAIVRFLGNFSALVAASALIGKLLSLWVGSVHVAPLVTQPTPTGLDTVSSVLATLRIANAILLNIGWALGAVTVLLLGLGLLYWLTRSAYTVEAAILTEISRLRKRALAGTLDKLPDSDDMSRVWKEIAEGARERIW